MSQQEMTNKALQGLKVADFSWYIAGPSIPMWLAHHGAEVIRIESIVRPDALRGIEPFKDGIAGINRSCHYAWLNTGKRSITLNLKKPQGIEVVKRLVSLSDVVVENFTPGTMERLGLSYEELKQVNPAIIMVRLSGVGQDGPYRSMPALGNFIGAWAGLNSHLGMPDQGPIIGYVPHPDYLGAHAGVIAIIGSLLYRRRTGKGQYTDISMLEASIPTIAPAVLDYLVNGQEAVSTGNRSSHGAPHGIYRCAGEDRWCAISVLGDEEWADFVRAIGSPAWALDTRFATMPGRKENEDELDRLVNDWTSSRTAEEVMDRMQKASVAAGVVETGEDLLDKDPQLKHRNFFIELEYPGIGKYRTQEGVHFKLSKYTCDINVAPLLGEHNDYIFKEVLEIPDTEYEGLVNEGVID